MFLYHIQGCQVLKVITIYTEFGWDHGDTYFVELMDSILVISAINLNDSSFQ